MPKKIRPSAVAGQFYPEASGVITEQIQNFLKQAPEQKIDGTIKAMMVPHAGYDFSGSVAAYGFKQLVNRKINTAVLISNSHKTYFDGAAIDASDAWQTPLGIVAVDKDLANKLIAVASALKYNSAVHSQDHVLEVELPFLQKVLQGDFKIVPILFGNKDDGSYKKLAQALKDNLGESDLVVISSDMSHYPKYEDANKIDQGTLDKIKQGKVSELESYVSQTEGDDYINEQTLLCGIDAVKTALELARLSGWDKIEVLQYANSGDVPGVGDKSRVVGYGSIAIAQTQNSKFKTQNKNAEIISSGGELTVDDQKILLKLAKETVESFVAAGKVPEFNIANERLKQKQGAFVTLKKDGKLRGCIGQIAPSNQPLWEVVRDMAIAAATEDGRFNPVSQDELSQLEYEVSVLSAPEPIIDWRQIELGKHGVIIKQGGRSGVFLPQVASETSWSLEEFLSELCWQKAGLAPDCYKDDGAEIQVFTAQVFR